MVPTFSPMRRKVLFAMYGCPNAAPTKSHLLANSAAYFGNCRVAYVDDQGGGRLVAYVDPKKKANLLERIAWTLWMFFNGERRKAWRHVMA